MQNKKNTRKEEKTDDYCGEPIELRELMDRNEMLSHIFLGCMDEELLEVVKEKYVGEKNWAEESVKIPVEMKIGGIPVNLKKFFIKWERYMKIMILEAAKELVRKKLGDRVAGIIEKLNRAEEVLEDWVGEINWDVPNPLKDSDVK